MAPQVTVVYALLGTQAHESSWHTLLHLDVPAGEKVLRTVAVYLGVALLLRLAGKREMAALNSFDLVMVMLLSNVVQNAIIGPDNSLAGGLLGAVVLVGFNALWERLALINARTTKIFEGTETVLVLDGALDRTAIRSQGLFEAEVVAAVRRQGANTLGEVQRAALEPGGAITVELRPDAQNLTRGELRDAISELRDHLDRRLDALGA